MVVETGKYCTVKRLLFFFKRENSHAAQLWNTYFYFVSKNHAIKLCNGSTTSFSFHQQSKMSYNENLIGQSDYLTCRTELYHQDSTGSEHLVTSGWKQMYILIRGQGISGVLLCDYLAAGEMVHVK